MLKWELDPTTQIVHINAPTAMSMQVGTEVIALLTHLHENEGYDVHIIPDFARHEDELVTWYATSLQPDIGDLLNAVFALQTLADPRWKGITCRVIPASKRYTLARPTTQHARWVRQTSGHDQFADLTATFTPLPEAHAIILDAQSLAVDQWLTASEWAYYEKVMFEQLKQWAIIGIAGVPISNIGVKLDHILYHEVDSSPRAFARALRQACNAIAAEGLLVHQAHRMNE